MLELQRTVTIGQYIGNGSVVNRLDPRLKLVAGFVLIVLVSVINSFVADALFLIPVLLVLVFARLKPGFILNSMRPAVIFLVVISVFEVLFYQPPASGPGVYWHWAVLSVSRAGLLLAAHTAVRVLFLYFFVNVLTFTTSLVELADGAESLLSPLQRIGLPINELVMVLVIALKFVPLFLAELERLMKAQTARGARMDSGNIITRITRVVPLLVPLILSGYRRAETLTVAMEARGYRGGRGRTKRRVLRMRLRDYAAMLVMLAFCTGLIYVYRHAPF